MSLDPKMCSYFCTENQKANVTLWIFLPQLRCPSPVVHFTFVGWSPFYRQFSSVQLLSRVQHFATPWTPAHQASLSITTSQSLLKLMSIESVMPSNHLILCCPLSLLPSIFPSIRVFSDESVLHIRWPKTVEAEKALAQKPRVLCLPTAEKEFIRILSG